MGRQHLTDQILMIRPANFGFNEETAESNAFQNSETSLSLKEVKKQAIIEFDNFVKKLRAAEVGVTVIEDRPDLITPDSVFPNNWISFHQEQVIVTFPMLSINRRLERRDDIIKILSEKFEISQQVHLEYLEDQSLSLEGTGSMVLDRFNKVAYACSSPRTNEKPIDFFCKKMSYKKVIFESIDRTGQQIYHTNVMMTMGEKYVIIALNSIPDQNERETVVDNLRKSKKEIIEISMDQVNAFAGNMLLLKNSFGNPLLVMSTQAFQSLDHTQVERIENYNPILHSSLNLIEKFGGGSARCMMAEIFLPKKHKRENTFQH